MVIENLKNSNLEYDLQARIHDVLKEHSTDSVEYQSAMVRIAITEYFNHINAKVLVDDDTWIKKQWVRNGKLA